MSAEFLSKIHSELVRLRRAVQDLQNGPNLEPLIIVNVHADQDAQELADSVRRELDKRLQLR